MVALRTRPAGFISGPFWLTALCVAFMPTSIGYQDLAAFLARQPGVSERWREHLIASPFGTIHAATFSFTRPIGTAMPEPFGIQQVNFDPGSPGVKTWPADMPSSARSTVEVTYPTVNRALKGDRLPVPPISPPPGETQSLPQLQPVNTPPVLQPVQPALPASPVRPLTPRPKETHASEPAAGPRPDATQPADAGSAAARQEDDVAQPEVATQAPVPPAAAVPESGEPDAVSPPAAVHADEGAPLPDAEEESVASDKPPEIPAIGDSGPADASSSSLSFIDEEPADRSAQLYFGVAAMGSRGGLEQWAPGSAPVLVSPAGDPDIKLAALEGRADSGVGGQSIARKGDAGRLQSPAERLGLNLKTRVKAEKCLADAVYFEARGEPQRGQMAVAQVVMNRVFSGYYPNNVCGVVYQNANRHLACQFTFACDGIRDVVNEPEMWKQAKRIARDTLDGKIWLAEVGHATHYHAYWVHPSWVHEMRKMYRLGVHTFYRPRAWGDGANAPIWGGESAAAKPDAPAAQKPEAAKVPQAAASPFDPAAWPSPLTAKL